MNQQAKNEIRIFKKFARLCPYSIHLNSITKKEPPEPDISCNLSDGSTIAFELVECIDNSIAQSIYDSSKLKKTFDDKLERLLQERKERFKVNFRNALIYIAFIKRISANKKMLSIPTILDYLLTLESTAEGKFDLRSHPDLKNIVRWISIKRGKFAGPIFNVEAVTFFAEPAKERVEDKFKKQYKTKCKTDLLAYYELQPELPENHWLPSVQDFVKNNIKTSVFRRAWIYSVTKNKIIFVYPSSLDFEQRNSKRR